MTAIQGNRLSGTDGFLVESADFCEYLSTGQQAGASHGTTISNNLQLPAGARRFSGKIAERMLRDATDSNNNAAKMTYVYTSFGANNEAARDYIAGKLGVTHSTLVQGGVHEATPSQIRLLWEAGRQVPRTRAPGRLRDRAF